LNGVDNFIGAIGDSIEEDLGIELWRQGDAQVVVLERGKKVRMRGPLRGR